MKGLKLLALFNSLSLAFGIKVLHFQEDGFFNNESYAKKPLSEEIHDFTLCLRFKLHYYRGGSSYLFSFATKEGQSNYFRGVLFKPKNHRSDAPQFAFIQRVTGINHHFYTFTLEEPLLRWTHVCLVYDDVARGWKAYLNGVLAENEREPKDPPLHTTIPKDSALKI